ncbi:MAG: NAD(P)/FAD-dependent oxidoreductase [Lentisphaeria bacterium]|nr:NAD(P)/FAD-dependent oxidoreductase [Lentisphaeria bacterium]
MNVVVIGSGPAGLSAAYFAALAGCRVTVLEQLSAPGMKLLASGGGKCNVSNTLQIEEFARKFGKQWRFLLPSLQKFHGQTLLDFFALHQVELIADDGFHYFPRSGKSRDVLNVFLHELPRCGGKILCGKQVVEIRVRSGMVADVKCSDGSTYPADRVIIACGGKSYPALGGTENGYILAEKLGHQISSLYPAMCGIHVAEKWVHECAGISLADCQVRIDLPKWRKLPQRGELLFTHHGFSAFAVLDIAETVARLKKEMPQIPLRINFTPDTGHEEWAARFALWRKTQGTKKVQTLLAGYLPRKVAAYLLNDPDVIVAHWQGRDREILLEKLLNCPFSAIGTDSWERAMVTAGGVSLKDIEPDSMASRLVKGIYFAGEVLDVTGPCGGYNITWALASGRCAGEAASQA